MTTKAGATALQIGIYAKLINNPGLLGLGLLGVPMRIYDEPPPDPEFPFLTIGEDQAEDWGARDITGALVTSSIHIWTQGERGRSHVKQISDTLRDALHTQNFMVSGQAIVLCRFMTSGSDTPDGINWHGETKFKIILQSN